MKKVAEFTFNGIGILIGLPLALCTWVIFGIIAAFVFIAQVFEEDEWVNDNPIVKLENDRYLVAKGIFKSKQLQIIKNKLGLTDDDLLNAILSKHREKEEDRKIAEANRGQLSFDFSEERDVRST